MHSNAPLLSGTQMTTANFEASNRFQKQSTTFQDSAFFRMDKYKLRRNQRGMSQEELSAFLITQGMEISHIDKIAAEELAYSDLASLTHSDLEVMGVKHKTERDSLLEYFALLPNQDPTFTEICNQIDAKAYNQNILKSNTACLKTMKHALKSSNYKLQLEIPQDILVGNKYFASRFVTDAITELHAATDEIEKDLNQLSQTLSAENHKFKKRAITRLHWALFATISGITAMALYWYMKNHQT